jgi:DNA adenine methylase
MDNINQVDNIVPLDNNNIGSNNVSPLRYPGGKTRACKILDTIIKQYFDLTQIDILLSPFFGGGSFELYFQNNYNKQIIANDKFKPLYNFWNEVKINKDALCTELYNINSITKTDFQNYRNTILEVSGIIQALQYFVINRCSFSGATLSGGFSEEASSKRFTKSSIDRIKNLNLSNIIFSNLDFLDFLNNNAAIIDANKTLIFLDPPYYLGNKSNLYGNNGDMHENFDHKLLFDVISSKKNWIITYNNCEYIKNLYKNYIILEVNWSYGMNKDKKSSEIVIISN